MPFDPDAFRAFEAEGWQRIVEGYDAFFSPITAHSIEPLLTLARVGPSSRLLDVATGPGHVAAAGAARGARVTGVDVAPAMVAQAKERYPNVSFSSAPAEQLPFGEKSFTAVTSNFGLGHFVDPKQTVAEMARVLERGGRVALSWWDEPSRARLLGVFHEAVGHAGVGASSAVPVGPPFFRYSQESELAALLREGGFTDLEFRRVEYTHRLLHPDELFAGVLSSTVRTAAAVLSLSQEAQRRVRAEFERLVAPYVSGAGLNIPVSILLGAGQKPSVD